MCLVSWLRTCVWGWVKNWAMMEISTSPCLCTISSTLLLQEPPGTEHPLNVSSGLNTGDTLKYQQNHLAQGNSLVEKIGHIHTKISNIQPEERTDPCIERKVGLGGQWRRGHSGRERWLKEKLAVAMPLCLWQMELMPPALK